MEEPRKPTAQEEKALFAEIHKASKSIFGTDFNSNLVKTAQMNMVMNNDGRGGLFALNALWKPSHWPEKEAQELIELGSMDFVMANPPFGTKIKVEGQDILEQYDLAHAWTKQGDSGSWKGRSGPPCRRRYSLSNAASSFLKPGTGKLGIVVPDGILGNPDYEYIRYWILANCQVLASVDLPVETFLPRTGTQTSVLILRRKSEQEKLAESLSGEPTEYRVFMAIAKKVGKDRRGNIIYRRDSDGREIIQGDLYQKYRSGNVLDFFPIVEPSGRIVDDHLPKIAEQFLKRE